MTDPGSGARPDAHLVERLYAVSLLIALGFFYLVNLQAVGSTAGLVCLFAGATLVGFIVLPENPWADRLAGPAALLIGVVVLAIPFLEDLRAGSSLPASIQSHFVWPQILVLVFASRLLSCRSDARATRFWQSPLTMPAGTASTSIMASILLGGALTLAHYRLVPAATGVTDPLLTASLTALRGESAIHVVLVFLFSVILASLIEAARIHIGDRMVLRSLASARRASRGPISLAPILASRGAIIGRATRVLARDLAGTAPRLAALDAFGQAERTFLRGLIALLPVLGFLGTVIGLALAVADLQGALGPGADPAGLAGVFAGLAVKFETTLLGLLFSLVAGLLLAFLERSEAQATAAAAVLVDLLSRDGHGTAG